MEEGKAYQRSGELSEIAAPGKNTRRGRKARFRLLAVSLDSRLGGGLPAVAHGLVDEVQRRGVEARLVESRLGLPAGSRPELARDGAAYLIAAPGAALHDPRDVLRDCADLFSERAFEAVLDDWDPALVFFLHTAGLGMSLVRVARRRGLPTIVFVGDYYLLCPVVKMFQGPLGPCQDPLGGLGCSRCTTGKQELAPLYNFRLAFALDTLRRTATLVNAQSQAVRRILLRFGVPAEKIKVLFPGVKGGRVAARARRQPSAPVAFGFVGNAGYPKGCHVLVEAFLRLPRDRATLTFYGGGPSAYLEELRERGGERVRFAGAFHPAQLDRVMREVDVGVVPSLWEECGPLVVSEFLHHGVPVIGSEIGGIPEQVVAGEDGFLVPPGDAQRLEQAMASFIDEPALLERMPAKGRKVKTMGEWAQEIIALGEELIAKKGPAGTEVAVESGREADAPLDLMVAGVAQGAGHESAPEATCPQPQAAKELSQLEALRGQGKLEECAQRAQALLSEDGLGVAERVRLHRLAAQCLAKSGDFSPARQHLENGLALEPQYVDLLVDLGALELAAGRGARALEVLSEACRRAPDHDRALCGLGLSLSQCGQPRAAFERLVCALVANPENLTALCALTPLAYQLNEIGVLEARLRAYLDHHPGNPDMLYALAGCLFRQGRLAETASELRKILLLCPDHELARDLMRQIAGEPAACSAGRAASS